MATLSHPGLANHREKGLVRGGKLQHRIHHGQLFRVHRYGSVRLHSRKRPRLHRPHPHALAAGYAPSRAAVTNQPRYDARHGAYAALTAATMRAWLTYRSGTSPDVSVMRAVSVFKLLTSLAFDAETLIVGALTSHGERASAVAHGRREQMRFICRNQRGRG